MVNFDNRVVLLTGAARGLGLAYARTIAEQGGIVLLQDIGAGNDGKGEDPKLVHRTSESLRAEGLNAIALTGRIDTKEQCQSLVAEAIDKAERLDAIIHNAGWVAYQEIEAVTESDFDRMMNIAAKTPLWLTQAAWSHMKAAKFGRIVFTTSDRAIYPQYVQDGLASYAAAKMAAVGLVNVLASEGQPHGIMVNAVSPVAKTRMWGVEGEPDELHPAEVAWGVAYLVSEGCQANGWILRASNGQFHATKQVEAEDVDYPRNLRGIKATTVKDVAANWSRIAVPTIEPRWWTRYRLPDHSSCFEPRVWHPFRTLI